MHLPGTARWHRDPPASFELPLSRHCTGVCGPLERRRAVGGCHNPLRSSLIHHPHNHTAGVIFSDTGTMGGLPPWTPCGHYHYGRHSHCGQYLVGGISDSVVKIGCRVESIRPGKLTGQVAMVAMPRLLMISCHFLAHSRGIDGWQFSRDVFLMQRLGWRIMSLLHNITTPHYY